MEYIVTGGTPKSSPWPVLTLVVAALYGVVVSVLLVWLPSAGVSLSHAPFAWLLLQIGCVRALVPAAVWLMALLQIKSPAVLWAALASMLLVALDSLALVLVGQYAVANARYGTVLIPGGPVFLTVIAMTLLVLEIGLGALAFLLYHSYRAVPVTTTSSGGGPLYYKTQSRAEMLWHAYQDRVATIVGDRDY